MATILEPSIYGEITYIDVTSGDQIGWTVYRATRSASA